MKRTNRHIKNPSDPEVLTKLLFSRVDISFEKSMEEILEDLLVRLREERQKQYEVRRFLPGWRLWTVAASLILLLAVTGFMRFYQKEAYCPVGQHSSLILPDGSGVEINAQTSIKYHPYWWFFSRKVSLEGEAFFDVKKGKHFRVVSSLAATSVLGTTFNIYARDGNYRVTCLSGFIRVTSNLSNERITLSPNECADLDQSGIFDITSLKQNLVTPGWVDDLIMFASTPLRLVFDEIERQYGIIIESSPEMNQLYSGQFSLNESVDKVLYLLCRPFDLEYEQYTGNKYIVYPARME